METGSIINRYTYKSTAEKTDLEQRKGQLQNINKDGKKPETKKSIRANELKLPGNNNSSIKELFAQRAALKVRMDQFKEDTKLDGIIKEHMDKMDSLQQESDENQSKINSLEDRKEDLKETYGIEDDSTEQKDLLLLEKQAKRETLTDEEKTRLASMGPLTEYQKASLEYSSMEAEYRNRIDKATEDYFNENRTITAIKLEILKDNPMVDADKEAEGLLKKVDEELQQSLIEEVKSRVNEKLNIDPNTSILDDPDALIVQKKATEDDMKGLAVDEKV